MRCTLRQREVWYSLIETSIDQQPASTTGQGRNEHGFCVPGNRGQLRSRVDNSAEDDRFVYAIVAERFRAGVRFHVALLFLAQYSHAEHRDCLLDLVRGWHYACLATRLAGSRSANRLASSLWYHVDHRRRAGHQPVLRHGPSSIRRPSKRSCAFADRTSIARSLKRDSIILLTANS